jgi:hypothetical protein
MSTVNEGLHRRLAKAVLAGMRALFIVVLHPGMYIGLQLFQRAIYLASEGGGIELILDRLMEALADAVGLGSVRNSVCKGRVRNR